MELKQIRYFITIVDYGSLTKAANQLQIAQPALSLQLSHLEAECRAQLLIRTPKGVEPTEIGKIRIGTAASCFANSKKLAKKCKAV
jgi:LysR family nitrogen assimilation transcriptional regulator